MAKLKIYTFPDLVLAKKAQPIEHVDKTYHKLADDMLETMYHAPGVGLAANQVGVLERILVIDTEYDVEDLPEGTEPPEGSEVVQGGIVVRKKPKIIVNPEIIHKEGSILYCEGCLSVPEYTAEVKRAEKIKVKYRDIDGIERTLDAEGLMAVCIQHEIDHLDGKLFIERLSPIKKEMAKRKLLQAKSKSDPDDEK